MIWNLNDPPVIVYNAAEEFVALAKTVNVPNTQAKIINTGVNIIRRTQDFETGLSEWFDSPEVEHVW